MSLADGENGGVARDVVALAELVVRLLQRRQCGESAAVKNGSTKRLRVPELCLQSWYVVISAPVYESNVIL